MKAIARAYHNLLRFIDKNPVYFICSNAYFWAIAWLTNWNLWVFLSVALLLFSSCLIAFSSTAEKLMRFLNNIRRLESAREKAYLRPLFEEVCQKAKAKNPELPSIDIYIIDSMTVNACAMGLHTVAVTKGAMHTFSESELKAVLAHEIAHILNMDTSARIYILVGNGIFSVVILFFKLICWLIGRLLGIDRSRNILQVILDGFVHVFLFLLGIVMAISDRRNERRADEYTVTLGYGEDMVEALYLLEKIRLEGNQTVVQKLLSGHPRVTARLENLEKKLGLQDGE